MTNILTGFSATLPTDTLLGTMVLLFDSAIAYGATSGEPTVNLPKTFENLAFDGKILPRVGLDRKIDGVPSIDGVFFEMNTTKAGDLEPNSSTVSSGGIDTITPGNYGDFLPQAAYKENVRAICRRGGGGIVAIEFDWALVYAESMQGASTEKAQIKMHIEARQGQSVTDLGAPLHRIKLAASIDVIVAADP